jgi:hypothetical protein
VSALATGGDITFDNYYFTHTFNHQAHSLQARAFYADYLVVAGGGGGKDLQTEAEAVLEV